MIIGFNFGNACNFRCSYCIAGVPAAVENRRVYGASTDEVRKVVRLINQCPKTVDILSVYGGEPGVMPHIPSELKKVKNAERVCFVTNGSKPHVLTEYVRAFPDLVLVATAHEGYFIDDNGFDEQKLRDWFAALEALNCGHCWVIYKLLVSVKGLTSEAHRRFTATLFELAGYNPERLCVDALRAPGYNDVPRAMAVAKHLKTCEQTDDVTQMTAALFDRDVGTMLRSKQYRKPCPLWRNMWSISQGQVFTCRCALDDAVSLDDVDGANALLFGDGHLCKSMPMHFCEVDCNIVPILLRPNEYNLTNGETLTRQWRTVYDECCAVAQKITADRGEVKET